MKKIVLLIYLTLILLTGCSTIEKKDEGMMLTGSTVEVFGCEYIRIWIPGDLSFEPLYIHKNNCKYCEERRQEYINRLNYENSNLHKSKSK